MKQSKLLMSAIFLAASVIFPTSSVLATDDYPSKPIHITVVWPAGGGHDLIGRLLSNELSAAMDTPVVVDNVTGAGGSTGVRHIVESDPDGYTVGVVGLHAVSAAYMNTNAPKLEGLEPLIYVSDEPGALQISAKTGIDNLEDYVKAMKADPAELLNGNDPKGGNSFVFAQVIPEGLGVEMTKLPYPGHAPTVAGILTGEVQTTTLPVPPILEHALAGTINVLGVASETRHPNLPDVPTFKEQGYDIVVNDFVMIAGPKGIPADVSAKLEAGLLAAVNSDSFKTAASENGIVLRPLGSSDASSEFMNQQEVVYPLLEKAGLVAPELKK